MLYYNNMQLEMHAYCNCLINIASTITIIHLATLKVDS